MKLPALLLVLSTLVAVRTTAQAFSGFSSDAEGWSVSDFPDFGPYNTPTGTFSVTWVGSGGNPGGFISSGDVSGATFWFAAPSIFLGDQSATFGSFLRYDIQTPIPAPGEPYNPPLEGDVVLIGEGLTLIAQSGVQPGLTSWSSFSVSLSDTTAWHVGTMSGALATNGQIEAVLGNLDSLLIRGEYVSGQQDLPQLDNVGLAVVPEPSTWGTLAALSLLGGVVVRRIRK